MYSVLLAVVLDNQGPEGSWTWPIMEQLASIGGCFIALPVIFLSLAVIGTMMKNPHKYKK